MCDIWTSNVACNKAIESSWHVLAIREGVESFDRRHSRCDHVLPENTLDRSKQFQEAQGKQLHTRSHLSV